MADRNNLEAQHQIIYELASFLEDELGQPGPDSIGELILPLLRPSATDNDRANAVAQLSEWIQQYDPEPQDIEEYLSDSELIPTAFAMLMIAEVRS